MKRKAVILIKSISTNGLEKLRAAAMMLAERCRIEKVSSVYLARQFVDTFETSELLESEEAQGGLTVALLVSSDEDANELNRLLLVTERKLVGQISRRDVRIRLLLMEDVSLKTPELTLPQPELHLRPEELVPASEVWGSYYHPILGRTLAEVALGLTDKTWGDFYCQGPELLATT